MVYPTHVKELAYKLDPECWVSYSGKPRDFKAYMDARRTASLRLAEMKAKRPVTPEMMLRRQRLIKARQAIAREASLHAVMREVADTNANTFDGGLFFSDKRRRKLADLIFRSMQLATDTMRQRVL